MFFRTAVSTAIPKRRVEINGFHDETCDARRTPSSDSVDGTVFFMNSGKRAKVCKNTFAISTNANASGGDFFCVIALAVVSALTLTVVGCGIASATTEGEEAEK